MKAKDRDQILDALLAQMNSANYATRVDASAALARMKPRLQDLPALRKAFRDRHRNIACNAVVAVAKIQPPDAKVIDALIAAATGRWECGCPQLFDKAIAALVKLSPNDPRVLAAIQKALAANNHVIRRHAIVALQKVASPAALTTLRHVDKYLGKHPLCCDRLRDLVAAAISDLTKKAAASRR